jgi:hypothetical protein
MGKVRPRSIDTAALVKFCTCNIKSDGARDGLGEGTSVGTSVGKMDGLVDGRGDTDGDADGGDVNVGEFDTVG